jgi:hypothetical protein
VLVLGLGLLLAIELRRRGGGNPKHRAEPGPQKPARDHFADADRLAAQGDYRRAVMALAGGVAAALGGDDAWDRSTLTVRELFRHAPRPGSLRPLLLLFEGASYGERQPGAEDYRSAAAAAAPFRAATAAAPYRKDNP